MRTEWKMVLTVAVWGALLSCDARDPTAPEAAADPAFARHAEAPQLPPPADFVDPATDPNPYFPLIRQTIYTYRADTEDGVETTTVTVTGQTRVIEGIAATVVLDEVYLEGRLIERTFDWFGQDRWGNVWYLGEESCEYEEGSETCNPAGSWEVGVAGARAGIIMWADPVAHRGRAYHQEFYEGEAEDMGMVVRAGVSVHVPAGDYTDCIETLDWTPLDPGAREHKFYCAGTGLVLELKPRGGRGRNELVSKQNP